MEVKCTLCDKIDNLDDSCFQAKRLRNRRTYMYLCPSCYDRVKANTEARHATGNFYLYREKKDKEKYI